MSISQNLVTSNRLRKPKINIIPVSYIYCNSGHNECGQRGCGLLQWRKEGEGIT
jgi:hypothetical protein